MKMFKTKQFVTGYIGNSYINDGYSNSFSGAFAWRGLPCGVPINSNINFYLWTRKD